MALEIKLDKQISSIRLVSRDGSKAVVEMDGKIIEVDIEMVEDGVYSILHGGKSFNIELIPADGPKNYFANTYFTGHEIEIIDAQSRYLQNRNKNFGNESEKSIVSPMPGKIVRVLVSEGENVDHGTPVIVVSAMKMESEYFAPVEGFIKKVYVKEGDTVPANQILIEIE